MSFQNNLLIPSETYCNLGVTFDSSLLFLKHISKICRSSFYQILQLRQIRSSLDSNSAIVLANTLVSAKLDYCNYLYYKLPDYSLQRFQLVQNALARVAFLLINVTNIFYLLFPNFTGFQLKNVSNSKLFRSLTKLYISMNPLIFPTCLLLKIILEIFAHPIPASYVSH